MSHCRAWLTLCAALLLSDADAGRAVAPLPLHTTPALTGRPALTLPAGTVLTTLSQTRGAQGSIPAAVVYGERVYFASGGLVADNWSLPRAAQRPGPELTLGSAGMYRDLAPAPLPLGREITVTVGRGEGENRAAIGPRWDLRVLPLISREPAHSLARFAVSGPPARRVTATVPGTSAGVSLGTLPPGRYLLTASPPGEQAVYAAQVFEVTDLALLATAVPGGVTVQAHHALTGEPLPGVVLRASTFVPDDERYRWQRSRDLPAQRSSPRGEASYRLRDRESLSLTAEVTLRGVTHRAALFLPDRAYIGDPLWARTFLQTDKPVYRPGETLRGFALLRPVDAAGRAGSRVPLSRPVILRLRGPGGLLGEVRTVADEQGLARYTFAMPENVRSGDYWLEAVLPGVATVDNPRPVPNTDGIPVKVRAFVRLEFTLEVQAPAEVVAGERLPLVLNAEAYAGGPAPVRASLYRLGGYPLRDLYFQQGSAQDDSATFQSINPASYLSEGSSPGDRAPLQTVAFTGQQTLNLPTTARGGFPSLETVLLRATDEFGRAVYAEQPVTVHPAALKLVLDTPSQHYQLQERARGQVRVLAVGSGAPLSGVTVAAQLLRIPPDENRSEVVWQGSFRSDAAGAFTYDLPLSEPGSYELQLLARDAQGRATRGNVSLGYRQQAQARAQRGFSLGLTADRERYAVGDVAALELRSDLPAGTPLTLVWAAEGRTAQRAVRTAGPVTRLRLPVTAAMSPGFSAEVHGTVQGQALEARSGLLYVPREDRRLQVSVTAPQGEVRPGQTVTVRLHTRAAGRGVPALVTLAAVNEAVYAVAEDPSPDPWRFFWGASWPQAWVVNSYAAGREGGGGGGRGDGGAPPRSDLREVAYFGAVQTGADGSAAVTFTMPELLGPYRLSARAFTPLGSTGESRAQVTVGLPLSLRLLRPQVLTGGDVSRAYLSAWARGGGQQAVRLSLLAGDDSQSQTVTPSEGVASAAFPLRAPAGASLSLTAQAERGNLSDALREEIPLRPAGLRERQQRSGSGPHRELLSIPAGSAPEGLTLTLAASPLQARAAGLRAVLRDPQSRWVTTDGVASALLTNLHLHAIAARLGWRDLGAQSLAAARRDLATLLTMRGEGGWGWTAGGSAQPDLTALALQAITAAATAGLTDAATLQLARRDAGALLEGASGYPRAQLAAALAGAGQPAAASALLARTREPEALAVLALALLPHDRAASAAALRAALPGAVRLAGGGLRLEGDDIAGTAALAQVAAAHGDAAAAALAAGVWSRQTGGAWPTPRQTAAAAALLRSQLARERPGGAGSVTVELGGLRRALSLATPQRLDFPAAALRPETPLVISGPAHLAWTRELRHARPGAAPAAGGVRVERSYSQASPERDSLLTVTLRLTTPRPLQRVRITDPLAGGLEAADDRPFVEPGNVYTPGEGQSVWAERSIFFDRAVFYLEELPAGTTTIAYRVRALAAGRYQAPAPYLESAVSGKLGEGLAERIEVREAGEP